jgi:hypothetical protein
VATPVGDKLNRQAAAHQGEAPFVVEPIEGDGLAICARWEKLAKDQREE